jgi:hypothetical protein
LGEREKIQKIGNYARGRVSDLRNVLPITVLESVAFEKTCNFGNTFEILQKRSAFHAAVIEATVLVKEMKEFEEILDNENLPFSRVKKQRCDPFACEVNTSVGLN